jgi:FLVCR family feline leukemia virus subgroup C receptor-related protein
MYNKLVPTEKKIYHYKEYKSRWFMLYIFICALISNIMFGFSLSPIAQELSTIYSINNNYLQFLTVSFTIFTCVMIIPGNILNEKYGIRITITLGSHFNLIYHFKDVP